MKQTPLFNKFRVSEFIQFFTDVIKICTQNAAAATQVSTPLTAFKESLAKLSTTFKVKKASDITAELSKLDAQRDQDIICLRKMADAYSSHFDEELKTAGNALLQCIDKYGSRIYMMNYQAQTSTTTNLCNDLNSMTNMQTIVQKLSVSNLVAHLEDSNNRFNDLYINRVSETTADESISSGEAVKVAMADYRTLIEHIEAYSVIAPSESNTNLQAELDTLIGQYNSTMEQRSSDSESNDKDRDDDVSDNSSEAGTE